MKKIILLFGFASIFNSCDKDDNKCECVQERWERKATYTVATSFSQPTFLSATEWKNVDLVKNNVIVDCEKNGTTAGIGSQNATINPGNDTYTVTEYENRIICP